MINGFQGRYLRVNLTDRTTSVEEPDASLVPAVRRRLRHALAYFLLKELAPGIDPLGPENKLIIASGPLHRRPLLWQRQGVHRRQEPHDRRHRQERGGRLLRHRAEARGLRRHHRRGQGRQPGLPVDQGRRGRDPRRLSPVGQGRPGDRGRDPGRDRREVRPRGLHRPGRREAGALRLRDQRPQGCRGPDGPGGRDGLQEPEGDRGQGQDEGRSSPIPRRSASLPAPWPAPWTPGPPTSTSSAPAR